MAKRARYKVVRELGRGGMGAVYLARDEVMGRVVALKVIRSGRAGSEVVARFVAEARATAALSHPALVPTYTVNRDGGTVYFTMEAVNGRTLGDALKEGLRLEDAVRALASVCRGVAYAHARGLVHRDLKPANVMLTEDGGVRILDWGLVRTRNAELGTRNCGGGHDVRLTGTAGVVGTPAYLSPEQGGAFEEKVEVGAASDVYALGAILYECSTGTAPHRGSFHQILAALAAGRLEPPSVRAPERLVPRELEAVCLAAMRTRPEDRYESAAALAADLESWLAGGGVSVLPPPWPVRVARRLAARPLVAFGAILAVLALLVGVWGAVEARARARARARAEEEGKLLAARGLFEDSSARAEDVHGEAARAHDAWVEARNKWRTARDDAERFLAHRPELPEMKPGQSIGDFLAETKRELAKPDWTKFAAEVAHLSVEDPARQATLARGRELARALAVSRLELERALEAALPSKADPALLSAELDEVSEWSLELELDGVLEPRPEELRNRASRVPGGSPVRARAERMLEGRVQVAIDDPPGGITLRLVKTGEGMRTPAPLPIPPEGLERGEYAVLADGAAGEVLIPFFATDPEQPLRVKVEIPSRFPDGTVYVAPGEFLAGDPTADTYQALPRHRSRVDRGFFIQRTEVTIREWCLFLEAVRGDAALLDACTPKMEDLKPLVARGEDGRWSVTNQIFALDYPVFGVTYLAASAYARWKTETGTAGWIWRLPTASEWELAAGGPAGRVYSWGNVFDPARVACSETRDRSKNEYMVRAGDLPAGASLAGALQMAGNVWEWVRTPYRVDCVELRGGSFGDDRHVARVAARAGNLPHTVYSDNGVRLLCAPPEVR